MSEWNDMSTCGLLIQRVGLVQYKTSSQLNVTCFRFDIAEEVLAVLNTNVLFTQFVNGYFNLSSFG